MLSKWAIAELPSPPLSHQYASTTSPLVLAMIACEAPSSDEKNEPIERGPAIGVACAGAIASTLRADTDKQTRCRDMMLPPPLALIGRRALQRMYRLTSPPFPSQSRVHHAP